jgi:integral membrane sensor domain MASE1
MAGANTLESLLAAYLVNRYASGRHALQNPGNSLRFAGVLLLSSMTLSATAAATSLALGDVSPWTSYGSIWFTVVLGNFVGCCCSRRR